MSRGSSVSAALIAAVVTIAVLGGFGNLVVASGHASSGPAVAASGGPSIASSAAGSSALSRAGSGLHPDANYVVKFTESGLPAGTLWNVNLSGGSLPGYLVFGSTGATIQLSLPNGAYSFNVSSSNTSYVAPGASFTVNGAPLTNLVAFQLLTFTVAFTESGLPSGDTWYINVTGGSPLSGSGATTTLTEALPNGTYTFTVRTNDKTYEPSYYTGSFTVNGAGVSVPTVTFTLLTFSVKFTQKTLPSGTEWFVNISGQLSLNSTTGQISTSLPNGSYTYKVGTLDKQYQGKGGSFSVTGSAVAKTVTYTLLTFTVTITESGLPSGTSWGMDIPGVSGSPFGTTGTTIITSLPNGTYPYTLTSDNLSWAGPPGSFTVNGTAVPVSVTFSLVTYSVTFTETGLPSGTEWWANISGEPSQSSTGATISIPLPNGTYPYKIGSADKSYSSSPASFVVNGATVGVLVPFGLVTYNVSFSETGLPSGVEWFVNLTGGGSYSSTTSSLYFFEPNGSYPYTVGSANRSYAAVGGSVTVNGANVSTLLTYSLVTYSVAFSETGLPSGASWWVNLTNGQSFTSTTSSINFVEPNGSYTYTVATNEKKFEATGGTFAIHGSSVSRVVTFSKVTLSVTFSETGLPAGKTWLVALNGSVMTATTGSIVFGEVNGTYPYLISGPAGFRVTGVAPSGTVTVAGSSVTVTFTFTKGPTYAIHFGEAGLPKGESWCVTVAGLERCSTTPSLVYLDLTPGSYNYAVLPMPGQTITARMGGVVIPLSGTLGVAVKSLSVALKYVYPYAITFTEGGLTPGTSWSITLRGVTLSSTTTTITFNEPNGTYGYRIGAETGYTSSGTPRPVKVVGAAASVAITFTKKSGGAIPETFVGAVARIPTPTYPRDHLTPVAAAGIGLAATVVAMFGCALRMGRKPGEP